MRSRTPWIWLAGRSVRAAPRDTLVRVTVAAVAVVIMLIGCSLEPTALARSERAADQLLPLGPPPAAGADGVLVVDSSDHFYGQRISRRQAAVQGSGGQAPPGMPLPAPGELVVSPRMAVELAASAELRSRYPGRIRASVPSDQLLGPRSLVLWEGVTPDQLGSEAGWLGARGAKSAHDIADDVPAEIAYAVPMLVIGFLLPLVALLALLATLGGARREERLAALRLIGLTDREAKQSAALESGMVALVGVLVGLTLFLGTRDVIGPALPVEGGVWPEDIRLPWVRAVVVAVAFPVISVIASWFALHVLTTSPLGVERRSVTVAPRRWPLMVLASGIALLALALLGIVPQGESRARVTICAAVLLMIGAAGSVPVGTRYVVLAAGRVTRSVAGLVAFRRIEGNPARAARVAVGLTLMVTIAGPLLVFFPLIADLGAPSLRALGQLVGQDTIVSTQGPADAPEKAAAGRVEAWAAASEHAGIASALTLHTATIGPAEESGRNADELATIVFADCEDLEAVAHIPADQCRRGLRTPGAEELGWKAPSAIYTEVAEGAQGRIVQRQIGPAFSISEELVGSERLAVLLDGISSPAVHLIPRSALADATILEGLGRTQFIVPTGEAMIEAVRSGIVRSTGASALTVGESDAIARRATREFQLVAQIAGILIVLVAGLATMISAVEAVAATERERRLLWVGGAPRKTSSRAVSLQAMVPTLMGVIPGAAMSLLLARAFADLLEYAHISAPIGGILVVAGCALAAPAAAVGLINRLYRPTSLTLLGE